MVFQLAVLVLLISDLFKSEFGLIAQISAFRETRESDSKTGVKNPCLIANIKSGSIVWRKILSTVNHGRCNRMSYNSSALICVYLSVSAVKKR